MLSLDHEILVELFRDNAALAAELLRACAGIAVDHARVQRGSIDLSQVAPARYHADAVAVLHDDHDRPVTGVIVEVQRHIDRDKLLSWPVYLTTLRAQLACATVLLVIAPAPDVAAWARRTIELGHPGFQLTPIVIGFDDVSRIRDHSAASHLPELAMLSVLAHPELEIAEAAIGAIAPLPADRAQLYLDVIMNALPPEVRRVLEARMIKGYEYRSDFARRYYGQGRDRGRQEGLQVGRQAGLQAAVVALARCRLDELPEDVVAAIEALSEPRDLTELVTALGQAHNAAEARATLDRVLRR
jgi:hypothetical protein